MASSRREILRKSVHALAIPALAGVPGPGLWAASPSRAAEVAVMVGQLLVVGLPGHSAAAPSAQLLAQQLAEGKVGGSVLLRHNVKDRDSLLGLTQLFVRANPMVLNAVDQEGGMVQRLSRDIGFSRVPRAQWVARHLSAHQARELYFEAGEEMRRAGFNLNLAPSVDWHDPDNPVIGRYGRSFGNKAAEIEAYAGSFVAGMERAGLASTLKHFPGHGTSSGDSHNGFVDISGTWGERELKPFRALAERAQLVMGGHLIHPAFSDGGVPITFSRKALQSVLRKKLRFNGVIITDDLDMGAIRNNYSLEDAVVRSLQAGNDLLLMSNSLSYDPQLPDKVALWVLRAIEERRLPARVLATAYTRVMRLKQRFAFAAHSLG